MKITLKDNSFYIDDIKINEDVFRYEKVGYVIRDREQLIDDLCMWISEATGSDRKNDLYLMKEDLKYLMNLEDEFVFSSIDTNDYIAKSDNSKDFNDICKEIIKVNEGLK